MYSKALGDHGEILAEEYLMNHGFKIIAKNFRSKRWGEIDIIAKDGETIVFVEVKTRSSKRFGNPEEAISYFKVKALKRTVSYYLMQNRISDVSLRFDVISIIKSEGGYKLKYFKNAMEL